MIKKYIRRVVLLFAFSFCGLAQASLCELSLLPKTNWTQATIAEAKHSMMSNSMKMSRSVDYGESAFLHIRPGFMLSLRAKKNYKKAIRYILDNYKNLDVNEETATDLNSLLTYSLVSKKYRADVHYRTDSLTRRKADRFYLATEFYSWLETKEASEMQKLKPIQFAELIHNNITVYDSFPDGNTRTARLLADLVLIKAGYRPAVYPDKDTYNLAWTRSRKHRMSYYFESVIAGQRNQLVENDQQK